MVPQRFDPVLIPPEPDFRFEVDLWNSGLRYIAGVDEAGRGALAGPVAAAALVFPADPSLAEKIHGVRDSKQMTPSRRQAWADHLPEIAVTCSIGFASHMEIDDMGIVPATRLAIARALAQLRPAPEHLLVDYLNLPNCAIRQTLLVKGDARSLSIAAASILAKTARDTYLRQLDIQYPGYGFSLHKGYGTRAHCAAIERLGYSPVHRRSFKIKI